MSLFKVLSTLTLTVLLVHLPAVQAHDGRPVFVSVEEINSETVALAWRVPPVFEAQALPVVSLVGNCTTTDERPIGLSGQRLYQCTDPFQKLNLTLHFPEGNPSLSTVVNVIRLAAPTRFLHSGPEITEISLTASNGGDGVFGRYVSMGVEHILSGFDHLLFVLCIIWLAFSLRRILLAVTGFTLAHSITLAMSALDVFTPRMAPTEVLIALSIVFVAAELVRSDRQSLSWRYPVLVSSMFGLIHGFGFAGAIREIGLPAGDSMLALAAFNLGVELGQLLFVALVLGLAWLIRSLAGSRLDVWPATLMPRLQVGTGCFVGVMAAYWFVGRLLGAVI